MPICSEGDIKRGSFGIVFDIVTDRLDAATIRTTADELDRSVGMIALRLRSGQIVRATNSVARDDVESAYRPLSAGASPAKAA
jgi:hypothetical protein